MKTFLTDVTTVISTITIEQLTVPIKPELLFLNIKVVAVLDSVR